MPRGVPKAGYRNRRNTSTVAGMIQRPAVNLVDARFETDEEIDTRISERFDILEMFANYAVAGDVRSLIVSGPAGLGKSYTVDRALAQWDPNGVNHTVIKGYVKATGLYKMLYQHRFAGQVIVFDDADTIFFDDTSLNMLKAVCDTNETRRVSYLAEFAMFDEETSEKLPRSFEFNGTIIFITNLDFDDLIARGHKLAPHLQAMVSRSHYIDMAMKTKRDYLVRIKQVVRAGLLSNRGLSQSDQEDVLKFIDKNQDSLRELSLRMALKVGDVRKMNKIEKWETIARVTCCKS